MIKKRYDKIKLSAQLWLAKRLPPCKEIVPLISQSLEQPLSLREKLKLRLHLLTCKFCIRYLEQLLFMRDVIHQCGNEDAHHELAFPSIQMSPDARERIKRALEKKQK